MIAVGYHFRFHDGNETLRLTDRRIASEDQCIVQDGHVRWLMLFRIDTQDAAPFGEASTPCKTSSDFVAIEKKPMEIHLQIVAAFFQVIET